MLETMYYPDEVRPVSQVPGLPHVEAFDEKELETAKQLIEQLTTPFEPEKYKDTFREDVQKMLEEKMAGHVVSSPRKTPSRENVVDLLAALQASVDETKGKKPEKKGQPAATPAQKPQSNLINPTGSKKMGAPKKKEAKTAHKKRVGL
jgi:DNA end-binding protein Ku